MRFCILHGSGSSCTSPASARVLWMVILAMSCREGMVVVTQPTWTRLPVDTNSRLSRWAQVRAVTGAWKMERNG